MTQQEYKLAERLVSVLEDIRDELKNVSTKLQEIGGSIWNKPL